MKNIIYIDSNYIFLTNKNSSLEEKFIYDESDKKSTIKYIFKKFKDNKYLNKGTFLLTLNDYSDEFNEYLHKLNKIDIFSLNLQEHNIEKIICDRAIYKYDGISKSYEKTNFNQNLYSLGPEELNNYLMNQVKNSDCLVLILLKIKDLKECDNAIFLRNLFDIVSSRYKKTFDASIIINIFLDVIIAFLAVLLFMRAFIWENMSINLLL